MANRTFLYYILLMIILFASCNLFETRSPEPPEGSSQNYPPSVSPQILMDNFVKSLNFKNIAAYSVCFVNDGNHAFNFVPAAEAVSIYPGIFDNWDLASEKLFAQNFFSKFGTEDYPSFSLSNQNFISVLPDSAVFVGDYEMVVNSRENSINNIYKGSLQMVLVPSINGIWLIYRWYDLKTKNDGFPSLSILKAKLKS